jgi:hypothetical protein
MQRGGVFMWIGSSRAGFIFLLLLCLSACGATNENKLKTQLYPQDGYMGMTSVNPNNPLNPTYHHYQDDSDLMKAVLAQFPDIQDSKISIRGPVVYVKLQLRSGLDTAKAQEIRSAAQRALSTNMPRYRVVVSIKR